jgi:YegS/Rv2252/BmrU family lipid kinase
MANQPIETNDKWMAIVNPQAGTGKGEKDWGGIYDLLYKSGIKFEVVFTKHREHATTLTKKFIKKGFRKFMVVGGDGTLNEVVNGIFTQKDTPSDELLLAMIPVGTGNDWCRTFDIPFNYKKAVKLIRDGNTFIQDVGKVSFYSSSTLKRRYFINVAGMGYDAIVAAKTNKDKEHGKGGTLTYLKNLMSSLLFYKYSDTQIRIKDQDETCKCQAFSLSIGIGKYNGGGMKQLPQAIPDDGLFDITLVKKLGKFTVIKEIKNLYDGSFVNHPKVQTFRGKSISVESTPAINLEVDGESLGHSPFEFEIIHKGLRIVAGK